jgi:hypothetical protein
MVSFMRRKKKLCAYFFNRFFNDVELKSTQKQAIAAKQNIHTLTVNRTDQTDAGRFLFSSIFLHFFFFQRHVQSRRG